MSYSDAVLDAMRQRRENGDDDIPLNMLILARAVDAVLPGKIEARNGNFYMGGARLSGINDLYGSVLLHGVQFKQVLFVGDQSGLIPVNDPPAALLGNYSSAELIPYIGRINAEFLGTLQSVWDVQIRKAGLVSDAECNAAIALIGAGVVVFPDTQEHIGEAHPRLALDLWTITNDTPERRRAWYEIAEKLKASLQAYYRSQISDAAAAVRAAQSDVAFWDSVYKTVETIRDLPATAAGLVVDGAKSVFWNKKILTLALLAAGAVGAWLFWPQLARFVASKRTAAAGDAGHG